MVDCIFHRTGEGRLVNATALGELGIEDGLRSDRREWGRYRMMRLPRLRFLAGSSSQGRTGLLRDFGLPGFGLVVREPLAPGTEMTIRLPGPVLGGMHLFSAEVRHSIRWADSWLVGCKLSRPLTDEEVQKLFRSENV
jgi:PilZ domain